MKKKLRIAQVAPLWYTIPPKKYGGAERIIAHLTVGLTAAGHSVTLFASPGSKTRAQKIISIRSRPLRESGISWSNKYWDVMNVAEAVRLAEAGHFDVVHTHTDFGTVFFAGISAVPIVRTFHSGLYANKVADEFHKTRYDLLRLRRRYLNVVFISRRMKELAGLHFRKSTVIYNGIDTDKFVFNGLPEDYFLWVGRIEKKKGIENAIEASRRFGSRLIIAGRIDEGMRTYFKSVIRPRLSRTIRYVGELNEKELVRTYGKARALLNPIEWEEPFGLVVAEAMSCGTPVIAYRRGSMPELIEHGKTGYIVESAVSNLIAAMKKIDRINRTDVRVHAVSKFSAKRMVAQYEKFYYELL